MKNYFKALESAFEAGQVSKESGKEFSDFLADNKDLGGLSVHREQFELTKIKLDRDTKCCTVEFKINYVTNEESIVIPGKLGPNVQVLDTFEKRVAELKPYMCKISKHGDDTSAIVTDVLVSGYGETLAFKIDGVDISDSEQYFKITGVKVQYSGGSYGFENEVREIIESIEQYAFDYIFKGKKAQLTLGLDDVEDAEEVE